MAFLNNTKKIERILGKEPPLDRIIREAKETTEGGVGSGIKGHTTAKDDTGDGRKFPITSKDMEDDVQRQWRSQNINTGLNEPPEPQTGISVPDDKGDWGPNWFDDTGQNIPSVPTDMDHTLANLGTIGADTVSSFNMERLQKYNPAIQAGYVTSKLNKNNEFEFKLTPLGKQAAQAVLQKYS